MPNYVGQALQNLGQTVERGFTQYGQGQLQRAKLDYEMNDPAKILERQKANEELASRTRPANLAKRFMSYGLSPSQMNMGAEAMKITGDIMGAPLDLERKQYVKPDGTPISDYDMDKYGDQVVGAVTGMLVDPIEAVKEAYDANKDDQTVKDRCEFTKTPEGRIRLIKDAIKTKTKIKGALLGTFGKSSAFDQFKPHEKFLADSLKREQGLIDTEAKEGRTLDRKLKKEKRDLEQKLKAEGRAEIRQLEKEQRANETWGSRNAITETQKLGAELRKRNEKILAKQDAEQAKIRAENRKTDAEKEKLKMVTYYDENNKKSIAWLKPGETLKSKGIKVGEKVTGELTESSVLKALTDLASYSTSDEDPQAIVSRLNDSYLQFRRGGMSRSEALNEVLKETNKVYNIDATKGVKDLGSGIWK